MNQPKHRLSPRWKKIGQFVCLAGCTLSLIFGGYTIFNYSKNLSNSLDNSPQTLPNPVAVNSVNSPESVTVAPEAATPTSAPQSPKTPGILAANCGSPQGGPTDNPIAEQYSNSSYPWTNQLKWNCVYNIQDFQGGTMVARFNAARDAAAANGGGVVYFPAGTYSFEDSISLKTGVLLRGEIPSVTDAKNAEFNPPSKLEFPKYEPQFSGNGTPNDTAFKTITTAAGDTDSNIGLVYLDINRAAISLRGDLDNGNNQNLVIFGIRSNNVAEPDPRVPDPSFQSPWLRYSYRFAANIKVNAKANILIANNRINDNITDNYDQPGYQVKPIRGQQIITYPEGNKVPFHYGNHYGIVVNRSKSGGLQKNANPHTEPGLFRTGITVRDNWVYHTMRVAISASGDGLVIQDNQVRDERSKQWWTDPTGLKEPKGAVTLENRAIDWSGSNVLVEGNQYEVYRHRIRDTPYLSVDGEGILIQECCGGTEVNGAILRNNQGNTYIGLYKIPSIKKVEIVGNKVNAGPTDLELIYVNADTNNAPGVMEDVTITNNIVNGGILARGTAGGKRNTIENNQGNNSASLTYSCHVTAKGNTGFEEPPCLP
ncbi:glycoside hydrolase family 55 protein [Laspinema olomoucense]|uniref:glycoside hydrolase family 55 protein n=1 Tax=Laspinema olomoucense TaxID=3231600 RepID=UPI0021BB0956|nr:glycoside hydrolase family 55 protein [Laspinema sp. D3d]MCT7972078.1 glycoside hydrolase family 55 protein [Laspinema sp. D3d]